MKDLTIRDHILDEKAVLQRSVKEAVVKFQKTTGVRVTSLVLTSHFTDGKLDPDVVIVSSGVEL